MKNLIIRALVALLVTSCAASVAAQLIPETPPPPAQGGQIDNLDDRITVVEGRISAAESSAAEARTAAARANDRARQTQAQIKGVRKDTDKLNDAVYGKLDKSKKRVGGALSKVENLEGWRQRLIAENGDLWWLAAKRGDLEDALAITPEAKAFFAAAREAGYVTDSGQFNAGLFVQDLVEHGEKIGKLENRATDLEANAWTGWTGIVLGALALIGVLLLGFYLIRRLSRIERDAYGDGGPLAPFEAARQRERQEAQARRERERAETQARREQEREADRRRPDPEPIAAAPVITAINPDGGAAGEAFTIEGEFAGGEEIAIAFVDNESMTAYAVENVTVITTSRITGTVPDVGGVTGEFTVEVTNAGGQARAHFNMI